MLWFLLFYSCLLFSQEFSHEVINFQGDVRKLFSLEFLPEGTAWDDPNVLHSKQYDSKVIVKFIKPQRVKYLVIQADGNDSYIVECQMGKNRDVIWIVPKVPGKPGIWVRKKELKRPVTCKNIFIRPGDGDQNFSVGRFFASFHKPAIWDELETKIPKKYFFIGDPAITVERIYALKLAVVFISIIVLTIPNLLLRYAALYILMFLFILSWFNFGRLHLILFFHSHDIFHYYMGSKYSPELGYKMLYRCMLLALTEMGIEPPSRVRDLDTNNMVDYQREFEKAAVCKELFSETRWNQFKSDIDYFTRYLGNFSLVLGDHGYNPTPFWNLLGFLISNLLPPTDLNLTLISFADFALLVISAIVAYKAFGFQRLSVFTAFWGTNAIADYGWIGNSFARMDWFALSLLGVSLLKLGYNRLAYSILTLPALLRVFPAFILIGLAFRLALTSRIEFLRMVKCATLVTLIFLFFEVTLFRGFGHFKDFFDNIKKHSATLSSNHVGIKIISSYSEESRAFNAKDHTAEDIFSLWKTQREKVKKENFILHYALIGLLVFGWALVVTKTTTDLSVVAIVSFFLVQIISASNYYYVFMALTMLLPFSTSFQIVGLVVAGLSILPNSYFANYPYDDIYFAISVLVYLWSIFALISLIVCYWESKKSKRKNIILENF